MPRKVRLIALKSMLSAKLAEGKIIVVSNDKLPEAKTKHVSKAIDHFGEQKETFLFVSEYNFDQNLPQATKAFKRLQFCSADVSNFPADSRNQSPIKRKFDEKIANFSFKVAEIR